MIERVVERPREISQIKKNGLASPAPMWRGKSLGVQGVASNPRPPPNISQHQSSSKPQFQTSYNDADNGMGRPQTGTDTVMEQISQMSPDELQAAQREIAAMFKPKNLDFLKKMALKKSGKSTNDIDKKSALQPLQSKHSAYNEDSISSSANSSAQVICSVTNESYRTIVELENVFFSAYCNY